MIVLFDLRTTVFKFKVVLLASCNPETLVVWAFLYFLVQIIVTKQPLFLHLRLGLCSGVLTLEFKLWDRTTFSLGVMERLLIEVFEGLYD